MRWVGRELESVDSDGDGAYHDGIEDLVVFGAIWTADVSEFPFEVYASVTAPMDRGMHA